MGRKIIEAEDFTLKSTWRVAEGSSGAKEIVEGPTTATKTVTFEYAIPSGVKVASAKVHSTWGAQKQPVGGYAIRTVNGIRPDDDNGWMVDVELDPAQTSVAVVFKYKSYGNTTSVGSHFGSAAVSEVYLLIETVGGVIYRVENGELVPYQFHRAENGVLIPYSFLGSLGDPAAQVEEQQLFTADGEQLYTSAGEHFIVLGVKT